MNCMPGAKALSYLKAWEMRLLLNAVGLGVAAVKMMAPGLSAEGTPAAVAVRAATDEPQRVAAMKVSRAQPDPRWIDLLLPVPEGFRRAARITSVVKYDLLDSSESRSYTRCTAYITLPEGLSRGKIDRNLRAVARKMYQEGAMSVKVVAYTGGQPKTPAATLTFAPGYDRNRDGKLYFRNEYQVVITHGSAPPTTVSVSNTAKERTGTAPIITHVAAAETPIKTTPTLRMTDPEKVVSMPSSERAKSGGLAVASSSELSPPLDQSALIDTLLPVPDGFVSAARVAEIAAFDLPAQNGQPAYTRRWLVVTLPDGMATDKVNANLRALARQAFENGAMSVIVVAFSASDGPDAMTDPIASLTFAPHGDWDRTDRVYGLGEYKAELARP